MYATADLVWMIPALLGLIAIALPGLMVDGDTSRGAVVDRLVDFITLRQAASELPCRRAGRKTHVATLYRWTEVGCRGVKLRYTQIGATRCTTRAWLAEFFDELTRNAGGPAEAPVTRTPVARQRAIDRADREMSSLGV